MSVCLSGRRCIISFVSLKGRAKTVLAPCSPPSRTRQRRRVNSRIGSAPSVKERSFTEGAEPIRELTRRLCLVLDGGEHGASTVFALPFKDTNEMMQRLPDRQTLIGFWVPISRVL